MNMLHRRVRTGAALSLLFLATLGAAGCDGDTTSPAGDEVVALGGMFSLTGNWSTLGTTSRAAMEIAVEDVNAWLASGNTGVRFTAVIEDTRLEPAGALASIQSLHARGARIVLGPQSSAEAAAVLEWANANDVIVISQSSTAGTLALPGDNLFRLTPSDTLEGIALGGLIAADGMRSVVPLWRDDPGNNGLASATRLQLGMRNIGISAGVQYSPGTQDFAAALATVRAQLEAAIAIHGADRVAVAHAGFDEAVDIFALAANDPVLGSVRWYGTDGTALSEPLRTSQAAAAFAARTNFVAPIFGVDAGGADRWQPVAQRIAARASIAPDAFALAVYDAVWLAAHARLAAGADPNTDVLKQQLVAAARAFHGTTGWTALNAAGDRQFGNFDFFALGAAGGSAAWRLAAQFDTQSGSLTRF